MKKIITSALMMTALSTSAFAAPYAGGSIGVGSILATTAVTYAGELPLKLNAGFGGDGFGIEAEVRLDIAGGTSGTASQNLLLYGGYLTYTYKLPVVLENKLGIKFNLGYLMGTMTDETSTSSSVGGIAYSAQVSYDLLKNVDLYVEYAEIIGAGADATKFVLGVFGESSYSIGAHYKF